MQYKEEINAIIDSLTLDEMIGQMMCFSAIKMTEEDILDVVHTTKAGSFFVSNETPERIKKITEIMNDNLKCPGMIAADIEYGPGSILEGECVQKPRNKRFFFYSSNSVYVPRYYIKHSLIFGIFLILT